MDCLSNSQTAAEKYAALQTFQRIAEAWSWLYVNLSCLSKGFTETILCGKLNVHKDAVVLFEMVNLISEVVKSEKDVTARN